MAAALSLITIAVGFVKVIPAPAQGVGVGVGVGVGGLAVVEPENENTPLAGGFWVVNVHEPGVGSKPLPLIIPVPLTLRNPPPCWTMVDVVRSNVNPPTLHRPGRPVEGLNIQGAAIVTCAPTFTYVAKSPDRLTTVGGR
ncbi:MAG: hypothetical protein WA496_08245 [Candidatus Udaeobacter sp.]